MPPKRKPKAKAKTKAKSLPSRRGEAKTSIDLYVADCCSCKTPHTTVKFENYCISMPIGLLCRVCCECAYCEEWRVKMSKTSKGKTLLTTYKRRRNKLAIEADASDHL
jgi:hypothetical protein